MTRVDIVVLTSLFFSFLGPATHSDVQKLVGFEDAGSARDQKSEKYRGA